MANFHLITVTVTNSTTITATFTENLSGDIDTGNVIIQSQVSGIDDATVLSVTINGSEMVIGCQPLVPMTSYYVIFQSTTEIPFTSLNGDATLYQNGNTNQFLILGPIEQENPIQTYLINYLRNQVYQSVTDSSSVVGSIIQALSYVLSRSLYDIRQVKNENYLSFVVNDEQKVRGSGPFDRLNEEAAYDVLRVGLTPTGTNASMSIPFDVFPSNPVSLLATDAVDILAPASTDGAGKFNINNFILTVTNPNVSILSSVTFTYVNSPTVYTYSIPKYGYQILDSTYDQEFAFSYLLLNNNQFKLSASILSDPNFSLDNIYQVHVTYQYRDLGRIIDASSVAVTTVLTSAREALPPLENIFSLQHAPITDINGNPGSVGDVTFLDPNAFPPSTQHPAFINELVFNLAALPTTVGDYAIDYASGTVYVFGQDTTRSGTGPEPPLATYNYLHSYVSEIDYVYDPSDNNLVSLPNGSLRNNAGTISFNYEQVLIPGIDYTADVHIENLSEHIENRLLGLNVIQTSQSPVTNVFRIFNQTTGEIYTPSRWLNNKVYFTYNQAPNIATITRERVTFQRSSNQILFVNQTLSNISNVAIYAVFLPNNQLIAATEDGLASSINTPIAFSRTDIFVAEKWFDINESQTNNLNRLAIGEYMVDYANGVVYVGVTNTQSIDLGTASYKTNSIVPTHPHLISVEDLYYQVNFANPKDKEFTYRSFGNDSIVPATFDPSDEAYLNGNFGAPYQLFSHQVGAFVNSGFFPYVTNNIKQIRGLYEFTDLKNNIAPINFAPAATFSGKTITVGAVSGIQYSNVQFDGTNYYVLLNQNLQYLSPNVTFTFTVTRASDAASLWNNTGSIVLGYPVKLVLPGINSPHVNDAVAITYNFAVNDLSRVIVNYNKGDYFADYTYLADEIIISYEYGDNYLDFSQSLSVPTGTQYYVSYLVGALRDALQKNFGALINIDELDQFEVNFVRERYRDALMAALTSFLQGPTLAALKNIVKTIAHIEPEIIESAFVNWSLGSSLLTPSSIRTTGDFSLLPAKYDNGILVNTPGQTISLPANSNLRIEQGTFETWVAPQWNGIDNDAQLTLSITKDGYAVNSNLVFIGAAEYHPTYTNSNTFTITKLDNVAGLPNRNKDGVYLYYAPDVVGTFDRWFIEVVDGYSTPADGYHNYSINVKTDGLFYDVKSMFVSSVPTLRITSGTNNLTFAFTTQRETDQGITFVADHEHYLLDVGEEVNSSRLSIYKDPSGYVNFRVYDNQHRQYAVSGNVADWVAGDLHHVAASWTLNTANHRDELHLFLDGFEVPNIIRYGGAPSQPYLHEKFRTINPEEIAGVVYDNIVGSVDLVTTAGSNVVASSLSFTAYGIMPGAILYINEPGFDTNGYLVTIVNGNSLTLSTTMPISITNGIFSINTQSFITETPIDVYPDITVSTISSILDGNDASITGGASTITSASFDFTTEGIVPGYLVRLDAANFASHYVILQVSGHSLLINGTAPATLSGAAFHIYTGDPMELPGVEALRPDYSISEDGYFGPLLTVTNGVKANDLILIETLGVNNRRVRNTVYQWGNQSNILQTVLPSPVSLNQVKITHVLVPSMLVSSNNCTLVGNQFTSTPYAFVIDQPSTSDHGRFLQITMSTDHNINFGAGPVNISITGNTSLGSVTEVVSFVTFEQPPQNTSHQFLTVTSIMVSGVCNRTNRTFLTLTVAEAEPITIAENSSVYPVIRYSYQTRTGTTLSGLGSTITDPNGFFSSQDINNYIVISSPALAAGSYQILAVSADHLSATINATLPSFGSGSYKILNATTYRSGLQNGFFIFEQAASPGVPYLLQQGTYIFDYYAYLSITIDPINSRMYFGTDFQGQHPINAIIDETNILAEMLTDTRIGEVVSEGQTSITKDFNSLKALTTTPSTLVLCHYDSLPLINSAEFFASTQSLNFLRSSVVPNDDFGGSADLTSEPIIIDNAGILNRNSGTIEFWVNPHFDTSNDPNYRFYFDATSTVTEEVVSTNENTVSISGIIGQVLSIIVKDSDSGINYFAGGRVEIDTFGAVVEDTISLTASSARVSQAVLQVVTVKIAGDTTNTDYFAGGNVGTDGVTLYLGRQLPNNNLALVITYKPISGASQTLNSQVIRLKMPLPYPTTRVVVTYIPAGTQGDRLSIFKDPAGYINFNIRASNLDYLVRAPAFWAQHTWHRVRATYQVNGGIGTDTIRLFVDGYEHGNILFGTGLIFTNTPNIPFVFGSTFVGGSGINTNIVFKDPINQLYLGANFTQQNTANALISNCRFSDIARPVFAPFGESIDVNYNSNIATVFPVTSDLYTTLLLNFDNLTALTDNFATLIDPANAHTFTVTVLDSFDIVQSSAIVKQVLEALLNQLKPANTKMFIDYLT